MSFTVKDLRKYLFEGPDEDDFDADTDDFENAEEEWYENRDEFFYEAGELPGFGLFKNVAQWNMGDGHECGTVFQHVESGRFFKAVGWYSSWDSGSTYETLEEVEPYEVTKIRYRKVSNAN